jgi:hypothetical protein
MPRIQKTLNRNVDINRRVPCWYYCLVRSAWCSDDWGPRSPLKSRLGSLAMTLGGALIEGAGNGTTTISVHSRSHWQIVSRFCKWFSLQIDRGVFYIKT